MIFTKMIGLHSDACVARRNGAATLDDRYIHAVIGDFMSSQSVFNLLIQAQIFAPYSTRTKGVEFRSPLQASRTSL